MVATARQILHEQNFVSEEEVEVFLGNDRILRVNIDGICALRVRIEKDFHFKDDRRGGRTI